MGFFNSLANILDPVAKIGSVVPGPWQVPSMAYTGARTAAGGGDMGKLGQLFGLGSGISALSSGRGLNREALEAQREALQFARQRNDETAPFRELAMRDILGATPEAPDLSEGFVDPTNPFASSSPRLALSLDALTRSK